MINTTNKTKGFTLIELIIATTILGVLIMAAFNLYSSFYNSFRNIKAANTVYEEGRFTMERIVKEIRKGTIDYEEYYNQAVNYYALSASKNEVYGKNYCQYSRQFYTAGKDGIFGTYDDENTGSSTNVTNPIKSNIQNELYLIETSGKKRTYFKLNKNSDGIGKIAMLKLIGEDYGTDHIKSSTGSDGAFCKRDSGENDGLIDTWLCETGYNCEVEDISDGSQCSGKSHTILDDSLNFKSSFIDITPSSIDVVDLKFFINPLDDPHKAYENDDAQIQPSITIKMTVQANSKLASKFKAGVPSIVLETTVSSRAYNEVVSACNTQECSTGATKDCPRADPLTAGSSVACTQGVWPVCDDTAYKKQVADNIIILFSKENESAIGGGLLTKIDGLDHAEPFGETGNTFYESTTEFGSCDTLEGDKDKCKTRRCSDGFDNDGSGKKDAEDPACVQQLCNNGQLDTGEVCIDVGGICGRYERGKELSCNDGYDNDCSYNFDLSGEARELAILNIRNGLGADEYDKNCIQTICSNGKQDKNLGDEFYETPNYLVNKTYTAGSWDEGCKDVGGLCVFVDQDEVTSENTAVLCTDGLDNNCNGKADEFDDYCKELICTNKRKDCDLVPKNYSPVDYLKGYTDPSCNKSSDNDEQCPDSGGMCGSVALIEICNDRNGKDEDCNGLTQTNDHHCITSSGKTFLDNFTSQKYISRVDESINWNKNGGYYLARDTGYLYSASIPLNKEKCGLYSVSIQHKVSGGNVSYQVSNDGGTIWCGKNGCSKEGEPQYVLTSADITANENAIRFETINSGIQWKTKFDRGAKLESLRVSYTCR